MAEEDKVRGLSPNDLRRILGDALLAGVKLLGKKSDDTFENIITDDEGRLQVYDPKVGSLISYAGTTTADGAGDGSTLIDNVLTTEPDFDGNLVIITSGDYKGQARDIDGVTTGGTVTPLSAFGGQIVSGVTFVIAALRFTPAEVAAILAILSDVFDLVNALLVLTETGGMVTATGVGTEDNVYVNDDPTGVFKPLLVTIDLSDLAGGEVVTVRTYYRIAPGGAPVLKGAPVIFVGVQAEPLKDIELQPNRYGLEVTLEGTTGVVFPWEVFYKV